jgi:hypothetical protein
MTLAEIFGLLALVATVIGIVLRGTIAGRWIVTVGLALLIVWSILYGDEVVSDLLPRHRVAC